ncbi:hypothetical protein BN1708_007221, partial [Verticillium longisporum]
RRAPLL